jgi:hypothetical protein
LEALALPVLVAEARLSSAVILRSFWSTRFIAAPFSPRADVDLLCTLARKSGFSSDEDPLAEAVSLLDDPYKEVLVLALAEVFAFALTEVLALALAAPVVFALPASLLASIDELAVLSI